MRAPGARIRQPPDSASGASMTRLPANFARKIMLGLGDYDPFPPQMASVNVQDVLPKML